VNRDAIIAMLDELIRTAMATLRSTPQGSVRCSTQKPTTASRKRAQSAPVALSVSRAGGGLPAWIRQN
jgi:hypothetical protein